MAEVKPRHLTVPQLGERWQKTEQYVYSNYKRLGLKALRIGQQIRFPLEEVERWERAHLG
jgi:hypothetical protein